MVAERKLTRLVLRGSVHNWLGRPMHMRTVRRGLAVSGLVGMALVPASTADAAIRPDTTVTITGSLGLDSCHDPTASQLQAFWSNGWAFWGIYIGGDEMACSQPNLNSSYISTITNSSQYWRLTMFWVGPQAPGEGYANSFSSNTSTAFSQGETQAIDAYNEAVSLGMGGHTPISYDLEAVNSSNLAASESFINGWDQELRVGAGADIPGLYGSIADQILQLLPELAARRATSMPPISIITRPHQICRPYRQETGAIINV
jgi:hypothetical protein